jgi:hypothetical protein
LAERALEMLQAYCSDCKKTVTVLPILSGNGLKRALEENSDVRVMHTVPGHGDHVWSLSQPERDNLRKAIAKDLL